MKYLSILIFTGFLMADFNPKEFTKIIIEKPREERKVFCLSKMNENKITNPKLAFFSANCLLYNGYGNLAIPLFTQYIYGKENFNKKYFNNRIGYGWLHSADWYNVGGSILSEMTEGKDLYEWTTNEIQKELFKNPSKYDISKALYAQLKNINPKKISKKTKNIFKECKDISIFINNYKCSYTRTKKLFDCNSGFKETQLAICND